MSQDSIAPAASASDLIIATPSPDDVGAATADRFEWQAAMAAADGLSMLLQSLEVIPQDTESLIRDIICEHHEDWVVRAGPDSVEIVSAKHRDPASGAFTTVNQMAGEGGLRHLFSRWDDLNEKVNCRLVTSGGLGSAEVRQLESDCELLRALHATGGDIYGAEDADETVKNFANSLLRKPAHLPKSWHEVRDKDIGDDRMRQIRRFLSCLRIQHSNVQRAHLTYAAPTMYVEPVLQKLGVATGASEVWKAVLGLFTQRMRAAGPLVTGALPDVSPLTAGRNSQDRNIQRRTVTVEDIKSVITIVLSNLDGYSALPRLARVSRVAIKMDVGKCHDNSIERAEQLRTNFQDYWRERESGDPLCGPIKSRLERRLLRIADAITDEVYSDNEAWGRYFWSGVKKEIDSLPEGDIPAGMDPDLLLGGVSDLANRCKVWFSDRFDAEAVQEQLRAIRALQ